MLNKKRVLAVALTSAMAAASLAACSKGGDASTTTAAPQTTTAAAAETTTAAPEAETTTEAETTVPVETVEEGMGVSFEDGNFGFIQTNSSTPDSDPCDISVVDFNGSKALKVAPTSTAAGIGYKIGVDISSLLGDKVADVATVQMDMATEATDGNFYACTGTISRTPAETGKSWVVYSEKKNPNKISYTVETPYVVDDKNVLMINKDADSGNNCDLAFAATGAYSTLYIDNIEFLDADGNAIAVDTTVSFDAPEGFGEADWSNLTEVSNQVIIPGFTASAGGWAQGPDSQMINIHEEAEVDEEGNPVLDEEGNPVVNQVGIFDWTSIVKPGMVLTFYFSEPEATNTNPLWLVMFDWETQQIGWTRIGQNLLATNDSNTMCQVTYEQLSEWLTDAKLANEAARPQELKDADADLTTFDFTKGWGMQCEGEAAWTVSAVTYAYTE